MLELIFDKDCFKILSLYSISPGSRYKRNQLKEKTKLNNVPLDNAISKLIKSKILKNDRNYYQINFDNDNAMKIVDMVKTQYKGLKEIPFDVYLILIDLIDNLSNVKNIDVYLFGSYSKLIFNNKSDVDIAVLTPKELNTKHIWKISKKLEKNYGKKVDIHDFMKEDFYKNKNDPLVREIIQNGVKLI